MNSFLQLHFKTRKLILIYTAVQTGGIRYRIPRRYGQTCKICFRISKITSISIKLKEKKKKKEKEWKLCWNSDLGKTFQNRTGDNGTKLLQ